MTYEEWRVAAVKSVYTRTIERLMRHYRKGQPTIVLLPGGMASRLLQSRERYEGQSEVAKPDDLIWIDLREISSGEALELEIDDEGRDLGQHAIAADGPLYLWGLVTPYDGAEKFFRNEGWNYLTFGYDWRRPLREAAENLRNFLMDFREAVQERYGENPLPQTHLYAHSQGGLVLKLFLNGIADGEALFDKAFTVATPFYGTSAHQQRYYLGVEILIDWFGYDAADVVKVVGSLPGPYSLMFLPKPLFDRYGAAIGLDEYPMTEPGSGRALDPYDPANLDRYLPAVKASFLDEARRVYDEIAAPLPQELATRFINIRGSGREMVTSWTWKPLPEKYEPGDDSPIEKNGRGPGDETVPAWSAWHAATPKGNQYDPEVKRKHTELAENRKVLKVIERLVKGDEPGSLAVAEAVDATPDEPYGGPVDIAEFEEVGALVNDRRAGRIDVDDPLSKDPRILRRIMQELMMLR